jgi:CheY-like chemotaxis protein
MIILIDDNELDIFINRKVIEFAGVSEPVGEFNSATTALQYLFEMECGNSGISVFLDLNMPDMNGFRFLQEFDYIRDCIKNETRIIILSSSTNAEEILLARSHPLVYSYLDKPLTIDKVKEVLKEKIPQEVKRR